MWFAVMEGNTKSLGVILRCVRYFDAYMRFLISFPIQFVTLRENLGDSFPLPPKHTLATSFIPLAWVDNQLIEERKRGLQLYLTYLIHDDHMRTRPDLLFFLGAGDLVSPGSSIWSTPVLPQMTSKGSLASDIISSNEPDTAKKPVAAAYYASWASDSNPPHTIEFSKFDILFFGGWYIHQHTNRVTLNLA